MARNSGSRIADGHRRPGYVGADGDDQPSAGVAEPHWRAPHLLGTSNGGRPFPGSVHAPHSFSVDPEGNLYIADYRNHRVQKFVPKLLADRTRLVGQPFKE